MKITADCVTECAMGTISILVSMIPYCAVFYSIDKDGFVAGIPFPLAYPLATPFALGACILSMFLLEKTYEYFKISYTRFKNRKAT